MIYSKDSFIKEHITHKTTFLGLVTSSSSSVVNNRNAIINRLSMRAIPWEQYFYEVGADETNVNIGFNGGMIRILELHLRRPVHS